MRVLRGLLRVTATLVALAVTLAIAYGWVLWRTFDRNLVRLDASVSPSGATLWGAPDGIDILLVGTDDRSRLTDEEVARYSTGRTDTVLTDTLILLHVPPSGLPGDVPVSLVSIPRDSWVTVHGTSTRAKINAAYEMGGQGAAGLSVLAATVEDVTGITVNHTLMVDFASFVRITEAVGPVEVCLKEATSDPQTGLELPAGPQVLQPEDALRFVRQRYGLPQGDLDRVRRQQAYLTAAAGAVVGQALDPAYMTGLVRTLGDNLFADVGFDATAQAATGSDVVVRTLDGNPLRSVTLPVADLDARRDGQSVVLLDEEAIGPFVSSLNAPVPPPEPAPLPDEPPDPDASPWVDDPACVW